MREKILILGGEGFIGRNLADYLAGFYDCYSLGIEKSIFLERKDKFIKKNPYVDMLENTYQVIIHLIDNAVTIENFEEKENLLIKNININKNNHLIIFSSAVVYADPKSEYGQRKIKLEKIYQNYCAKNKIKLTILRLFNVYGPYQLPQKQGSLVANIFCNHLNHEKTVINDPDAKRDFIYSSDVAKVTRWVIENKFEGSDDLATNKSISIKELLEIIGRDVMREELDVCMKNEKKETFSSLAKSGIIKNIRSTELKDGLTGTFNFYKDNLAKINGKHEA